MFCWCAFPLGNGLITNSSQFKYWPIVQSNGRTDPGPQLYRITSVFLAAWNCQARGRKLKWSLHQATPMFSSIDSMENTTFYGTVFKLTSSIVSQDQAGILHLRQFRSRMISLLTNQQMLADLPRHDLWLRAQCLFALWGRNTYSCKTRHRTDALGNLGLWLGISRWKSEYTDSKAFGQPFQKDTEGVGSEHGHRKVNTVSLKPKKTCHFSIN